MIRRRTGTVNERERVVGALVGSSARTNLHPGLAWRAERPKKVRREVCLWVGGGKSSERRSGAKQVKLHKVVQPPPLLLFRRPSRVLLPLKPEAAATAHHLQSLNEEKTTPYTVTYTVRYTAHSTIPQIYLQTERQTFTQLVTSCSRCLGSSDMISPSEI